MNSTPDIPRFTHLEPSQWLTAEERFGAFLESHVVEQLIAQAGWIDPDLHFYHYRDKDQFEVNFVIERGSEVWGEQLDQPISVEAVWEQLASQI